MPKAKDPKSPQGVKKCAHSRCKRPPQTGGYCRLHYLVHWKEVQEKEKDKAERRLNSYVDRMMKKYPAEYVEKIRESLETPEKFKEAMQELEPDSEESSESEREFLERLTRNLKIPE